MYDATQQVTICFRPQIGVISEIIKCFHWLPSFVEFPSPNWGYLWNYTETDDGVIYVYCFRPQIGVISEIEEKIYIHSLHI